MTDADAAVDDAPTPLVWRFVAGATAAIAIFVGCAMVLVAVTFGSCEAFGGRCPQEPPPLFDDDVFGMAALGSALAVSVPIFVTKPSKRRLLLALGVGGTVGLFVGLVARYSAHG